MWIHRRIVEDQPRHIHLLSKGGMEWEGERGREKCFLPRGTFKNKEDVLFVSSITSHTHTKRFFNRIPSLSIPTPPFLPLIFLNRKKFISWILKKSFCECRNNKNSCTSNRGKRREEWVSERIILLLLLRVLLFSSPISDPVFGKLRRQSSNVTKNLGSEYEIHWEW